MDRCPRAPAPQRNRRRKTGCSRQCPTPTTRRRSPCRSPHSYPSGDQQLCRWLLLTLDRLQGNQLVMTQELIANMLGVRREGVTEAAGKLQEAGLIEYSRGKITVVDRERLEKRVCECYAVVKREYDRLLPSLAEVEALDT